MTSRLQLASEKQGRRPIVDIDLWGETMGGLACSYGRAVAKIVCAVFMA